MTEYLSWRDGWSTGIDWVDLDHREMVKRLNQLAEACQCAQDDPSSRSGVPCKERVLACLDALIEHNRRHFREEEDFLLRIAYPGFEAHRREHVMQMAEFLDLRRDLERDLAQNLGPETLDEFKRWFFNHVIAEDHVYADFYHAQLAEQGAREDQPDPLPTDSSGQSDQR